MGVAVHQIHNLIRTYQHALQPQSSPKPAETTGRQDDRVSVSAEARKRAEQHATIPDHEPGNTKRER
jgi:hypothetical protein